MITAFETPDTLRDSLRLGVNAFQSSPRGARWTSPGKFCASHWTQLYSKTARTKAG